MKVSVCYQTIGLLRKNVEVSGVKNQGTFDKVREMVEDVDPQLAKRTHIWGGQKIIDFLTYNPGCSSSLWWLANLRRRNSQNRRRDFRFFCWD